MCDDPHCCGMEYCDLNQQLQMGADLVHIDCGGRVADNDDLPLERWYHYCGGEGGDECCESDDPKFKNVPPTICMLCDKEILGDFMLEARRPNE